MAKVLVLHGINLNMFGHRDPGQYGTITFNYINTQIEELAKELGVEVECFQSNHEGDVVDKIHKAFFENVDAVVINPGAWTRYSYGIRDALAILKVPVIECHMSNIHKNHEITRQHSVIAPVAKGQIAGFGVDSYLLGLRVAVKLIKN